MHGQFDEPIPPELEWELTVQAIVQETNWTFEYVESLSYYRMAAFFAYRGGQKKVQEHRAWLRKTRGK